MKNIKLLMMNYHFNPMPYNSNIHHRSSIRLKGYDYSQEEMIIFVG